MGKSEETVELVQKTAERFPRKSNSHLSQLLGIGIATCTTLRQNLGKVISLHPHRNTLNHAMYTNLQEWAHVHHMSHVLFSGTVAPKLLGYHIVQVTFHISCLLMVHSTTQSGVQHKLYDIQIYIKNKVLQNTYASSPGY
jgi:hypothetical protein